jgi:hypothetical protein
LRAVTLVARHLGRGRENWDSRNLIFVDNLVALACARRMRSQSMALLRLVRRMAAMALGLGVHMVVRWVPTHLNWADGPSHGEKVGIALQNKATAERASRAAPTGALAPEVV